jgi:hypothetical protein
MTYRKLLIATLTAGLMLLGAQAAPAKMAEPGNYPGGLPCTSNENGARACFQAKGDVIWVKDTATDDHSAMGVYRAYLGDNQYRNGHCRNKLKAGNWGYCNYDFKEDHYIQWWAAEYDQETGRWLEWSVENSSTN